MGNRESISHSVLIPERDEVIFNAILNTPSKWWPEWHSLFGVRKPKIHFEAREGGLWWEEDQEGRTKKWGEVVLLQPDLAIGLTWQIGSNWQPVESPAKASRLLFLLESMGENTLVHAIHYELEKHGEATNEIVEALRGPSPGPTLQSLLNYFASETDIHE